MYLTPDAVAAMLTMLAALSGSGSENDGKTRGHRRWYYTSRRGVVPYLEVSDEVVAMLEQGGAAIAEAPNGEAWLVSGECAQDARRARRRRARAAARVHRASNTRGRRAATGVAGSRAGGQP